MTEMQKHTVYFVPLYYYLSIPDFEKLFSFFNTSSLRNHYEIKLLDIQTNRSICTFNNNYHLNNLENSFESIPFLSKSPVKEKREKRFSLSLNNIVFLLNRISGHEIVKQKKYKRIISYLVWIPTIIIIFISRFFHSIFKIFKNNFQRIQAIHIQILHDLFKEYPPFTSIYQHLKYNKPAAIFVTSDLACINIRFTLAAAHLLNIPVIIYWMGDIEKPQVSIQKAYLNKILFRFEKKHRSLAYFRALLFNENKFNTFGAYAYNATLMVANKIAKQKLIDSGIKKERIQIITQNKSDMKSSSNTQYNLEHTKLIVFYTENLQSIYGEDYLVRLHTFLANLFVELHNKYGVQCIVRPHPMERHGNLYEKLIRKPFEQNGIIIDTTLPLNYLMHNALVNIAHFSKVLLDALLERDSILSINIQECNRTFIPKGEYHLLEARNTDAIHETLIKLLNNQQFYQQFKDEHTRLREQLLEGAEPFETAFRHLIDKKAAL